MHSSMILSAFGCALAVANAKWLRSAHEIESWTPARETGEAAGLDPTGTTPRPTPAPGARFLEKDLRKRIGTSTCGYFAQYSSSAALWCLDSEAYCIVDDLYSAIGCCDSPNMADCTIATTCVESTDASFFSADFADSYTIFCTESQYPYCVTYSYDAYDLLYPYYSAVGCGDEDALVSVEYYPPELGSAILAGITTDFSSMPMISSSPATSSSTSSTSTTTSSSATSSQPTSTPGKKTAVAPIAGGVVGGVAGLSLIGALIFFIVRSTRNNKSRLQAPPPVMATNMQYQGPGEGQPPWSAATSPMQQAPPQQFGGYPPAGFTAIDQRASTIAPSLYFPQSPKSQFETVQVAAIPVSPSISPAPTSPSTQNPTPGFQDGMSGPVSPVERTEQSYYSVQQHGLATTQQGYTAQQAHAAELPLTKPDGELRELE